MFQKGKKNRRVYTLLTCLVSSQIFLGTACQKEEDPFQDHFAQSTLQFTDMEEQINSNGQFKKAILGELILLGATQITSVRKLVDNGGLEKIRLNIHSDHPQSNEGLYVYSKQLKSGLYISEDRIGVDADCYWNFISDREMVNLLAKVYDEYKAGNSNPKNGSLIGSGGGVSFIKEPTPKQTPPPTPPPPPPPPPSPPPGEDYSDNSGGGTSSEDNGKPRLGLTDIFTNYDYNKTFRE